MDSRTYEETGNRFHPDSKRIQITFRGTNLEDQELYAEVESCRVLAGETFADYAREALRQRVDRQRAGQ